MRTVRKSRNFTLMSATITELLQAWKSHFSSRSKTKITDAVVDQTLQDELIRNAHSSHNNEDHVFDIDLEFEEVDKAVVHLSNGKAAGPDGMTGEHLKYGGSLLRTWITQIFNAILLLRRRRRRRRRRKNMMTKIRKSRMSDFSCEETKVCLDS